MDSNDWWSQPPAAEEPPSTITVPTNYTVLFNSNKGIDGNVPLTTFENIVFNDQKSTPYQKDEIIRIISAHAMSDSLTQDNWNMGLALLALAQQGEQNLSLGSVYSGPYPPVEIAAETSGTSASSEMDSNNTQWNSFDPSSSDAPKIEGEVWKSNESEIASYDPTSRPSIRINVVPQREGIFMFRHVVYSLEGSFKVSRSADPTAFKVIRRYSDFVWLLECLIKRFPFRLIPSLPPKRLTLDGKYLSSDDYFLERRRRGLLRFLDQVIKHPLLRKEKFVVMFLTVDTDMSSFRKQALMQISDELTGKVVSPNFTKEWDEQYQMQKWKETFQTTDKMLSAVLQLCHASERQSKRLQAMSEEYKRISRAFRKLTETVGDSVFQGSGDLPAITDGLKTAFGKTSDCGDLITDESRSLDYGLLEDLKQFRDQLIAIKEIFVRFRRLGKNSIPQLENRVANNSNRLRQLEGFADAKKSEINLLKESIAKDRMSIEYERNRSWLIRQCITDELGLCQKIVYQISKFLRDWSLDCTKYAELYTDNWIGLNNEVSELPLPS